MPAKKLISRIEPLIAELMTLGDIEDAALASILLAADGSLREGRAPELAEAVWAAWDLVRRRPSPARLEPVAIWRAS